MIWLQGQGSSFLVLVLFGWPYDLLQHRHYHHQLISIFGPKEKFTQNLLSSDGQCREATTSSSRSNGLVVFEGTNSLSRCEQRSIWNHTNYPHMVLFPHMLRTDRRRSDKPTLMEFCEKSDDLGQILKFFYQGSIFYWRWYFLAWGASYLFLKGMCVMLLGSPQFLIYANWPTLQHYYEGI